jgi:hypothetical protein
MTSQSWRREYHGFCDDIIEILVLKFRDDGGKGCQNVKNCVTSFADVV